MGRDITSRVMNVEYRMYIYPLTRNIPSPSSAQEVVPKAIEMKYLNALECPYIVTFEALSPSSAQDDFPGSMLSYLNKGLEAVNSNP